VLVVSGAARRTRSRRTADLLLRAYPVLFWSGVTAVAAWHPFDTTIDPGSIADKIAALLADPWRPGVVGNHAVDAVRYALFAASFAVVWDRLRLPGSTVTAVPAAASLGIVLETSQLFVLSRMPRLADVAIAIVGGCAGAASYRCLRRSSPAVAAVTTIVVAWLAAGLMLLPPPASSTSPRVIERVSSPGNDVPPSPEWRVSHAVDLTLAFVPIGFAVGMVVRPPRLWLAVAAIGGLLAVGLESGQSWMGGGPVNVTDAGVLMLGVFAGAWGALPARAGLPGRSANSW
jgi:glycopeptide antibiotics resistance protein